MRAYPLQWPDNWPRTPPAERDVSRYRQLNFSLTRDDLLVELERAGASNVVISSNLPLMKSGYPNGNAAEPADPGIALSWVAKDGTQHELACDQWLLTAENLRALLMAVQALRQLERCGATEIVKRAYQGFAALPPSSEPTSPKTWWQVLGVPHDTDLVTARAAYMNKLKTAHPDRPGGSHEAMSALNVAWSEAVSLLGGAG